MPPCSHCGAHGAEKKCAGCRSAAYCGAECQRSAWKVHKKACKEIQRAAAVTVASAEAPPAAPGGSFPQGVTFSLIAPPSRDSYAEAPSALAALLVAGAAGKAKGGGETWVMYAARAHMWLGADHDQHRPWRLVFFAPPLPGERHTVGLMGFCDDLWPPAGPPAPSGGPFEHSSAPLTVGCVAACLAAAIRHLGEAEATPPKLRRTPARVLLAPSGVAWLPSSARALGARLNAALPTLPPCADDGGGFFRVVANADDAPDPAAPSSSNTMLIRADAAAAPGSNAKAVVAVVPARDAMWYDRRVGRPYWMYLAGAGAETCLDMERKIMADGGRGAMATLRGHVEGPVSHEASADDLRALFDASAEFHEASPWEVLSNNEHLEIQLPAGVDGGGATTVFAMVAGHTDYDGRGLFVARSAAALAVLRDRAHCEGVDKLQYFRPAVRGMSDLDLVAELGLRTATNAPDNERYPVWFRLGARSPVGDGFEAIVEMMNATPPAKEWAMLALAARVVARWVADPMLADRERGAWAPVRLCVTFMPIPCGALGELGGATCLARAGFVDARSAKKTENPELTMEIGTRAKCNFCNLPKEMVRADPVRKIKNCSRCRLIWYCCDRCQMADWPRHKAACKKAAKAEIARHRQ